MKKPTLLVLAAGMGSRYGSLKQVDPVGPNGETIIDYSVYDALRAGFGRLVFVIRKEIEAQFKVVVGARFEKHIEVDYVFQELDKLPPGFSVPPGRIKPWGTTHAILMAAHTIREPFAAINADDFYGRQSYRLLGQHLQSNNADCAMVGFTLRNTLSEFGSVSRGICQMDGNDYLRTAVELTKIEQDGRGAKNTDPAGQIAHLTGDEVVSMNFWGFRPEVFAQLEARFKKFLRENGGHPSAECYIPNMINELVVAGNLRVKVLLTSDPWFGVTYREDRQHVAQSICNMIASGHYPQRLWA
jgi:hypothetical protein